MILWILNLKYFFLLFGSCCWLFRFWLVGRSVSSLVICYFQFFSLSMRKYCREFFFLYFDSLFTTEFYIFFSNRIEIIVEIDLLYGLFISWLQVCPFNASDYFLSILFVVRFGDSCFVLVWLHTEYIPVECILPSIIHNRNDM